MEPEQLKPCPFRGVRAGHLRCALVAEAEGGPGDDERRERRTDLTTVEACRACDFPEIYSHVNCANLIMGREHEAMESTESSGLLVCVGLLLHQLQVSCRVYAFQTREDYQTKCSPTCPAHVPLHRDANGDDLRIEGFDAATATDRQLRQAVLAVLYLYHSLYPERYRHFDLTPEVIARNLGLDTSDVLRVLGPMEDERELDVSDEYVRITSKGIQMIDEEPLFERLNTASLRVMGDQYNNHGQVAAMGPAATARGNAFDRSGECSGA